MVKVTFDNILKRYRRAAVVDHASLEIRPGELMALVGPSGSGKSVLARIAAGLEAADGGEIFLDGRLINGLKPFERRIGMAFQEDAVWPGLSVVRNIDKALSRLKLTRAERRDRAGAALAVVGIEDLADKSPDRLSSFDRLRVEIARALAREPEFLIVDEPFGRCEERERDTLRDELRELCARTAITTLVITADPSAALALGDRVALLDLGGVVQVGTPWQVYNRPGDAFSARFLGPANLIHGQVDSIDGAGNVVLKTPLGRLAGSASGGDGPAAGSLATISIRPEALSLASSPTSAGNRLAATVERIVFRGEIREVRLRGPGDCALIARGLQSRTDGLREGQAVIVHVAPEAVVVLKGRFASQSRGEVLS